MSFDAVAGSFTGREQHEPRSLVAILAPPPAQSPWERLVATRHRHRLASRALSRTEVARALMEGGPVAVCRRWEALQTIHLIRVSDSVLTLAGELPPAELRSLES